MSGLQDEGVNAQVNDDTRRYYDLTLESADYPAWRGQPHRTLIICTLMRSGSTLLGEAIYFAGGLGCPLEYFHQGFRPQFEARWKSADFQAYVSTLHRLRTDPSGIFSVKLFWHDVLQMICERAPGVFDALVGAPPPLVSADDHRRLYEVIRAIFPNPTFVFLTRRDELRQAVSNYVAEQTRRWRKFSPPARDPGLPQIAYSFDDIFRLHVGNRRRSENWESFFRANDLPYYKIVYEDLALDYEGTLRKFFTAIGRPDAPIVPPRLRKQADARSEALLQKFLAEFRQRARG